MLLLKMSRNDMVKFHPILWVTAAIMVLLLGIYQEALAAAASEKRVVNFLSGASLSVLTNITMKDLNRIGG